MWLDKSEQAGDSRRGGNIINQKKQQGQRKCRLWAEGSLLLFFLSQGEPTSWQKRCCHHPRISPSLIQHKWMPPVPLLAEAFGCYKDIFCSQPIQHSVHICRAPTVSCTVLGVSPSGIWKPRGRSESALSSQHRSGTDWPRPGRETANSAIFG